MGLKGPAAGKYSVKQKGISKRREEDEKK